MASATKLVQLSKSATKLSGPFCHRFLSTTSATQMPERFGDANGSSGWTWGKGGIGMGGKDSDLGTEAKPTCGKDKDYKVPEYFAYNNMSYYDIESSMAHQRVPQPDSGLTEYW